MTRPPARRHFVTLGERQVHLRVTGSGPPVLALHRPPFDGSDLAAFATAAAKTFMVVCVDLPGCGASDPLGGGPTVDDYSHVLAELVARLGLQRPALYAEGASGFVAMALRARLGSDLSAVVVADLPEIDGAAAWPEFAPRWDGAHLAWLWSYLREDAAFEPWTDASLASRRFEAFPTTSALHRRARSFLYSPGLGRNWRALPQAAAGFDARSALKRGRGPILILGSQARRTARWPERLAEAGSAPGVEFGAAQDEADAMGRTLEFLRHHAQASHSAPMFDRPGRLPTRLVSDYADTPLGQLRFHVNEAAETIPLLIQHDAASSVGTVEPITESLIGRRCVLAFDMPGSGLSDDGLGEEAAVADYADALEAALASLGLGEVDVYGMWGGGFVGLELARRRPSRVRRLAMSNVFFHVGDELAAVQANYTPPVVPDWYGGHLLQAWRQMRDQGLFFPWFDKSAAGVLLREPFLDPAMLHERVASLLQAGAAYARAYQAHFAYPVLARLDEARTPLLLASTAWDPNRPHTEAAAHRRPDRAFLELDPDFRRWGLSILPFLAGP